ncbi:hypothetical protein AC578_4462 [Pseudocercospora eumusae]|uniref:UBR-type domain-containing protein n=1 Tax=Pseudocercospora eumusae TaxID=321146 RepID=A0A139HBN4_9PEZI|nr:hypothetical protein AC578_4462 [Pseudocercospora eumusae]
MASDSFSQASETAQEYIQSQLSLEADAREALPYQFDTCTKPLGPLRQSVYACLTCTPPPASKHQQFTPAGVCYSCSISCHGEHNLVELFTKRDFVCDCGTTRFETSGTPCSLRPNPATGRKGDVKGEEARQGNKYNQNFQGRFCGCGEEYDPEKEKGTMFQCLGLGHVEDGGCGEDWWHPECLMGLPRIKHEHIEKPGSNGALETVKEEGEDGAEQPLQNGTSDHAAVSEEPPLPAGFPAEDDFDHLICYKCADAFPWIKQYSGTPGFLPAVSAEGTTRQDAAEVQDTQHGQHGASNTSGGGQSKPESDEASADRKRKAEDELEESQESNKKAKGDDGSTVAETNGTMTAKHESLPSAPSGKVSLFLKEDFRDHICRCVECFPRLPRLPQLLEEEDTYEPPVSESDHNENASVGGRSVGSGSILERGEAALSGMDRVRAVEGVMAYNHVREKVKDFLKPFAESGTPVGAEDIKAYFAKLRGDEAAIREAAAGASSGGSVQGDGRREQDGY